jgi:hypothetical protein
LSGPLQRNNRTPARVVAALSKAFKQVMVLDSEKADRSFAYASDQLPFDELAVEQSTKDYEGDLNIMSAKDVPYYLSKAVPLALDNLDLVLCRGLERFTDRYFHTDNPCREFKKFSKRYIGHD